MKKNIICLIADRLHCGFLGAYGNSEIETPALDALAAESFVADNYYLDTPQLTKLYRSFWLGGHAMMPERLIPESWLFALAKQGYQTVLLTDDIEIAYSPYREGFSRVELLPELQHEEPCETIDQTQLYQCFASLLALGEELAAAEKPYLLWCHFRAFGGNWDFPLDCRELYTGEEDPEPYGETAVPCFTKAENEEDFDDLCQSCKSTYAGGVSLFDELFEPVFHLLAEQRFGQETLFLLASARGIPLGEHAQFGISPDETDPLYGELVHVPLMVRFPDGFAKTVRSNAIFQPQDIGLLILDWLNFTPDRLKIMLPVLAEEIPEIRDHALIEGCDDEYALLTPTWFLYSKNREQPPELYVKSDDRWEVNDVANRCDEVVQQMLEQARQRKTELQQE